VHGILDKHDLKYDLEWRQDGRPFLTARGDLVDVVTKAIKEVTGVDTELSYHRRYFRRPLYRRHLSPGD